MNYADFEIEDFATDDSFITWVLSPDAKSNKFWKDIIWRNEALASKIEEARVLVLSLHTGDQTHHNPAQVDRLWKRIEGKTQPGKVGHRRRFSTMRIAASVSILALIAMGIGYVLLIGETSEIAISPSIVVDDDNFIEEVNTSGHLLRLHLDDGSIVSLEINSRLRYPRQFKGSANREVYLTGEGFFDVAKNSKQPFLVHTKEITTKVLGTSFRIKAYANEEDIIVAVKEGKVTVFSSREARKKNKDHEMEINGVVLTPNQQVTYTLSENSFNKTLVEQPEEIISFDKKFNLNFDNTPSKEVFAALEDTYGVEIIFDEETMQDCYLTVSLGDEPLFEKLEIICRTIGASFELIDAKVVVTGRGC